MQAAAVLYGDGENERAREIFGALGRHVFEGPPPEPAGILRRRVALGILALLRRTTRAERLPSGGTRFHNRILERSKHPYARTMLDPGASFVEGGNPMNAVYMMLVPGVQPAVWDRILLDSVLARDVQIRFFHETRIVHQLASEKLAQSGRVRIKAFAAGAGLSPLLVLARLLADAADPASVKLVISDREPANVESALRLAKKIPALARCLDGGLHARAEDALVPPSDAADAARFEPFDIVTAVGILEYFHGFTLTTTEEGCSQTPPSGHPDASDLLRSIRLQTAPDGRLVANSYGPEPGGRILEIFGKTFRYRTRSELAALAASAGFRPAGPHRAGTIYDVEAFRACS